MVCFGVALVVGFLSCKDAGNSAPVVVRGCPQVQVWSKEEQRALLEERRRLGSAFPLTQKVFREWVSGRDQARKCKAGPSKPG